MQGNVKLLQLDRGYGFIACADGDDVFFHHSAVPSHGFRKLAVGQAVEFELAGGADKSAKGARARTVEPSPPVDEPSSPP